MPTNDEIFEKVQSTLVDALGVDEEDVTRDATLFKDLGAESIDLLDIVFRLEKAFDIKSPRAPAVQPWGLRVAYLVDPSGVLWHVAQRPDGEASN